MTHNVISRIRHPVRLTHHRELGHVLVLLLLGVLLRYAIFDLVGYWGDYGFYQYDARLIQEGGRPFVDFLARSPLFTYTYATVYGLVGGWMNALRWFIIAWWMLTGAVVYLIGREIASHRVGCGSLALFLFMPFGAVYGMWANTMGMASFFGAAAIYLLLRSDDVHWYAIAGSLVGLSYLSRRSSIVFAFAIVLYQAYLFWASDRTISVLVSRAIRTVALGAAFIATIFLGYFITVGLDVSNTVALFRIHTVDLFLSSGRGSYPLIGENPDLITNKIDHNRVPIFNDLCQLCGPWTARVWLKTILIITPVVGVFWVFVSNFADRYMIRRDRQYALGALVPLALYAAWQVLQAGYPIRLGTLIALVLFGVVVHRADSIPTEKLYSKEGALVLIVIFGFFAGYHYRNRVLHAYYFMDLWPFVSIIGGLLYVRLWDQLDGRQTLKGVLVVAVALSTVTGVAAAYPLANVAFDDNDGGWFTTDSLHEIRDDLNERTDPGDVVFTAGPSYVATSHAKMLLNKPRVHMVTVRYEDQGPGKPIYDALVNGLENGTIEYVIYTRTTRQIFEWNKTAYLAFRDNYCRVDDDEAYVKTHAYLYRYAPDDCDTERPRESWEHMQKHDAAVGSALPSYNSSGGPKYNNR